MGVATPARHLIALDLPKTPHPGREAGAWAGVALGRASAGAGAPILIVINNNIIYYNLLNIKYYSIPVAGRDCRAEGRPVDSPGAAVCTPAQSRRRRAHRCNGSAAGRFRTNRHSRASSPGFSSGGI